MTTVVQTTYPQQSYPPQQNAGPNAYPAQQNAAPASYPPQPGTNVVQVPATTTTTNTTNNGNGSSKYSSRAGVVTGILQLIAAGILLVIGIIIVTLQGYYLNIGWNIWGSICFYMVSGILGISSKTTNKRVIVAYMVMSILSAICAGGQMIYDTTASSTYAILKGDCFRNVFDNTPFLNSILDGFNDDYNSFFNDINNDINKHLNDLHTYYCEHVDALIALHAVAAVTAFGEMVIAIVASCFCCCGVCGTSTPPQTTVVTLTTQPAPGTTYPVTTSAYPPQGQYAPGPPPSYTTTPPQQQQQQTPA